MKTAMRPRSQGLSARNKSGHRRALEGMEGCLGREDRLRTGGTHPRPVGASLATNPSPGMAEGIWTAVGPPGHVAPSSHFSLNLFPLGATVMTLCARTGLLPRPRTLAALAEPGVRQTLPSQPLLQGFTPKVATVCAGVCRRRRGGGLI